MRIYMVRHGQSVDNAHRVVSGQHESPLSELGRHQARLAGEQAQHLGIDKIVCSPLERTLDTATIIADVLAYPRHNIIVMEELRERCQGELEGQSYALNELLNGNFPNTEQVPGVEPLNLFYSRAQHVMRQLLHTRKYHNALIVCHMNVGRMLHTVVAGQPPMAMYDQPRLENGVIERLL